MRALLRWFLGLFGGRGGAQGDDAPGGWKEPVYDNETDKGE